MKKSIFVLTTLTFIVAMGLSGCVNMSNNTNDNGDGGSNSGTSQTVGRAEFKDLSFVYNREEYTLTMNYSLPEDADFLVYLRVFEAENNSEVYNYEGIESGKPLDLKHDEFSDGDYYLTIYAFPIDTNKYLESEETRVPGVLTINHPVSEEKLEIKNAHVNKFAKEDNEDGSRSWHTIITYDATPGAYNTFVYLFNEEGDLDHYIDGYYSGKDWDLGELKDGNYYFTIQLRGFMESPHSYQKIDYLNSDIVRLEEVCTVEPDPLPPIEKTQLNVTNLTVNFDHIVSWDSNSDKAQYNVSVLHDDVVVYSVTETTTYHALQLDKLEKSEQYVVTVQAVGDPELFIDSYTKGSYFKTEPDYPYSLGDNNCTIIAEMQGDYLCAVYTMEELSYSSSIIVSDTETGKILFRSTISEVKESGIAWIVATPFSDKTVKVELFVYDPNHYYRDGRASVNVEVPHFRVQPVVESVSIERVENHLEVSAVVSGEYDHLRLRYSLCGSEEWLICNTFEDGKFIIDLTEYGNTYIYGEFWIYPCDENDVTLDMEWASYSDPYAGPQIEYLDLDLEFTQTLENKKRILKFVIHSNMDYYPGFYYDISLGKQPVMGESIGSPNYDEATGTYKNEIVIQLRKSDLVSGETYNLSFVMMKRNLEETEDIYMRYTTIFVAL